MRKHLIALAATALLAACGGGADTTAESASTMTPAAAAAGLRQALAAIRVQAATPEQAAEQLLNFAQTSPYASYFPGNPPTQSFPPFKFRYYEGTGIYLGVVVTANMGFTMNGVYVMGGAFGDAPVYVGLVTDFITPTDPGTGTGANNGCYDLALLDTTGTHIEVTLQNTGEATGTLNMDWVVDGPATFEGQNAIQTTIRSEGTLTAQGETAGVEFTTRNYAKRTGDATVTQYGGIFNLAASIPNIGSMTTEARSIFNPAFVDQQYGLALGGSITQTQTGTVTTTTTITAPGLPPTPQVTTTSLSNTQTVKFVAREQVTVPAGTYNACKFEVTSTASGVSATSTTWVIDGKGIPVKVVGAALATGAGSVKVTQQATSVKLNGAPL